MNRLSEKKRFSIVARARSFKHAFRGLSIILKTQHNFWIQIVVAITMIALGIFFSITSTEWVILILTMANVLVAEAFNTALEIDIDLTSPTYHPYAKDTKDVAAGAVLIMIVAASIVGLVIFLPRIVSLLR